VKVLKPGEEVGVGEYSIAVVDERVEQPVVAFSHRHVEHEIDRVVLTDRMIVVRDSELNQLRAAAETRANTSN